ncbi:MAG: serine hydroxymethyltransferase, partial [Chloroflexi bacterium]|nr:serine hydroxymethyltransferase [Chloroflexota bacterium]
RGDRGRQADTIDLIASESNAPAAVLETLGSVLSNKTGEGYPGRRYHRGTAWVDGIETLAIERAKALFGAGHANVQPHAGVNANLGVYQAVLKPGDPVLAMKLAHGGHLSHGDPASITGRIYDFAHYGVRPADEQIDLDEVRDLAHRHRPRLIIAGGSSYPRRIDYTAFAGIAREVEALFMVDMAHVAGLVAADVLPSPVAHADFVTFTTYKTLLGPHGGVILSRAEHARKVDRAIFPGTQGAPDFGRIAGKAVAFRIAAGPWFREVQQRIVDDARGLAAALAARGDRLVGGGTDTHMVLVDLRARGLSGDVAERTLEDVGILSNRNMIPFDPGTPDVPSGIRFGTSSIAERGMTEREMPELGELIDLALRGGGGDAVRRRVLDLTARHPL